MGDQLTPPFKLMINMTSSPPEGRVCPLSLELRRLVPKKQTSEAIRDSPALKSLENIWFSCIFTLLLGYHIRFRCKYLQIRESVLLNKGKLNEGSRNRTYLKYTFDATLTVSCAENHVEVLFFNGESLINNPNSFSWSMLIIFLLTNRNML